MRKEIKQHVPGTFVSESIKPKDISFDTRAMVTGEPGLPSKFEWRGKDYSIEEILEKWKSTSPCKSGGNEMYVRKHWFKIRTTTGEVMTIYFNRQPPRSGNAKKDRWTLYTVERPQQ